jgi:predicted type IV restriction endonuclease
MRPPQTIFDLVERFERNRDAYKSGSYNETQVRREFIDPFFEALGWDVNNVQGYAEAYKDVIHEDAVKVGGVTKAPDYSFRIGGTRKFFVEAKKPSVQIKDDPAPAFQVRRYAWSAKLPLSIVTDFEELAVYDCRVKPDQKDRADKARIAYYTFSQYIDKWDEIAAIFSRDAILKGSFDKYAESHKAKRGTSEVDSAFLEEIESWRDTLAKNIALRNSFSVRELNEAVQRTIDRIIFLRIAEDRGIEEYGSLRSISNGANTFIRLRELFYKADDRYNSGLFHFRHEKGEAEPPDSLTISLTIDDKPLKEILKRLYYPDSPYEFAVLPADILGQVYEQFLGKVIRLTSDHRAVVEDKPEVKKAGGVFYTPTYIVEYIVKNTVGKLLEAKTPKQAEVIRVLDPACGSGSFLLGAYQFLLDWHLKWYVDNDPEKWSKAKKPTVHNGQGGAWHLTTAERKRILLNNIYGVDIDSQAVEVTKLSLLLKVLEGETGETLNQQMRLFHERALPDLGSNIKCGNSLIGPDFYDNMQMNLMADEEKYRVNVFDWQREFAEVFKSGGFDAVIGNPPYVRVQLLAHNEIDYLFQSYNCAASKIDLSVFFLERSLKVISQTGLVGLITTKQWMTTDYGSGVRELLAAGHLQLLLDFDSLPVFVNADTYPAILICSRKKASSFNYGRVGTRGNLSDVGLRSIPLQCIPFDNLDSRAWNLSGFDLHELCKTRKILLRPLSDFGHVFIGALTGMDEAFVHQKKDIDRKSLDSGVVFPYAYRGAEVSRYCKVSPSSVAIYPYSEAEDGSPILFTEVELQNRAIALYELLSKHKSSLRKRIDSRKLYAEKQWFRYLRPGSYRYIRPTKLIFKGIDTRLSVGLLGKNTLFNGANTPAFIPENLGATSLNYLLGILNSRLVGFHLSGICPPKLGGYFRFNATNINNTPIRPIDFTNPTDKARHDRMVQLVEQMITLHKQLPEARTGHDQTHLQRQIDATDKQIDKLVYELYGLTEDEIAVVEGA